MKRFISYLPFLNKKIKCTTMKDFFRKIKKIKKNYIFNDRQINKKHIVG